jgi:hypothetical protein
LLSFLEFLCIFIDPKHVYVLSNPSPFPVASLLCCWLHHHQAIAITITIITSFSPLSLYSSGGDKAKGCGSIGSNPRFHC